MQSPRKYAYYRHMRKTYSKQAVEARTGRPIEELLQDLYVERGYSFVQIGKALGVSRELIRQWVNEAELERPSIPAVLTEDDAA